VSKSIAIVGGGPSLKNFDFEQLRNIETIVTNVAILDVPEPTYFITVDYTFLSKISNQINLFKNTNCTKIFVADLAHKNLVERDGHIVDTRIRLIYKLEMFDIIIKARGQIGMGLTFNDFRTGVNSGYCALQLAVLLGYTKVYLFGIDLCINEHMHYHAQYRNNSQFLNRLKIYENYFIRGLKQLKRARPNIELISCSSISSLNKEIPYLNWKDLK